MKVFFSFFFLLRIIYGNFQINLHLTDWKNEHKDLQHDCLYIVTPFDRLDTVDITTSYCMSEWPSKWKIEENNIDKKFTFENLSKQGITSEQLYHWSAPIDTIENYQLYLDKKLNIENLSMIFYNCTFPYFGPKCSYVLNDHENDDYVSLNEFVLSYYNHNHYLPSTFTCYIHLQCNRGPSPSCLDWTEICDGINDCFDGKQDEENCWLLEIEKGTSNSDFYYHDGYKNHIPTADPTILSEDISCQATSSLTSSCIIERNNLLLKAIFSVKPDSLSIECWTALKCTINIPIADSFFRILPCYDEITIDIIKKTCPDLIYISAIPLLFGHVYFVYEKSTFNSNWYDRYYSMYVSYDNEKFRLPDDENNILFSDNRTFRLYTYSTFSNDYPFVGILGTYIRPLRRWLNTLTYSISNDSIYCNRTHMYQCKNSSKCISQIRLIDGIRDCYLNDDEDKQYFIGDCSPKLNYKVTTCLYTNTCIAEKFINDLECDCPITINRYCDDEFSDHTDLTHYLLFKRTCDNFTGLYPIIIDGQIHTDETDCEQWSCNNLHSHCDGILTCSNGIDETDCHSSSIINCPPNNHICLSSKTSEIICLSLDKFNDGHIDCIGALDEPSICPANTFENIFEKFHCQLINSSKICLEGIYFCDGIVQCVNEEDEKYCTDEDRKNYESDFGFGICQGTYETYKSNISKIFCPIYYQNERILSKRYFKEFVTSYPSSPSTENITNTDNQIIKYYQPRCHRGLNIQVWLNKMKNQTTNTCLCPPSFYGDRCQYQNQRVVIILEIFTMPDSLQTPFIISLSLIDDSNEQIIHSNEKIIFFAEKYCFAKFYIYLLYSNRPKNLTKQYSIHIDIYDRITLTYRGSIFKKILFPFLPVYRLNIELNIPSIRSLDYSFCSDSQCIHGQCRQYFSDLSNKTFCQCHQGWSGRYCTIQHICTCSFGSLCIGQLINNRSICICPMNKMGPQCLIDEFECQINSKLKCLNGGQCVLLNEYDTKFTCICPKMYTGEQCELNQTKIILLFSKDIIVPSFMRIHFISDMDLFSDEKVTIYKTVSFAQDSTTIYYAHRFRIIIFEWSNNYYLPLFYKQDQQSIIIQKQIHTKDRCKNINELFNQTILNYPRIHRMKFYQIPCRTNQYSYVSCFYDENYFCICVEHAGERVSYCFEFSQRTNYDCRGKNICENDGECYQDNERCPTTSSCLCRTCFYGTRCQLNTNDYSLSLDTILGYHIQPNINLSNQNIAVLISLILSIIICFIGLINSCLVFLTFKQKHARDLGCGIYLYFISLNCLFIVIIFTFKIWILVFSHIGSIKNRLFLTIQCYSIDYLLRVCLTIDHWLTACIAIERAYIIIKRTYFDRNKTQFIAKKVSIGILLLLFSINIQDPLNRQLFDEINDEEKRIWCIVNYLPIIHVLNSIVTTFCIISPFIINLISTIIIIIVSTRQRALIQKNKNYQMILSEQFRQHKNLLIAPIVLILLDIPSLIITFVPGCLKSSSDSWLFLIGYFLPFIPSLLTFILFVLPSTVYSQLFNEAIRRYRNLIRIRI